MLTRTVRRGCFAFHTGDYAPRETYSLGRLATLILYMLLGDYCLMAEINEARLEPWSITEKAIEQRQTCRSPPRMNLCAGPWIKQAFQT